MIDSFSVLFSVFGLFTITMMNMVPGEKLNLSFQPRENSPPQSISEVKPFLPLLFSNLYKVGLTFNDVTNKDDQLDASINHFMDICYYFERNIDVIPVIDVFVTLNVIHGYFRHLNDEFVKNDIIKGKLMIILSLMEDIVNRGGEIYHQMDKEYYENFLPAFGRDIWYTASSIKSLPKITFNESLFAFNDTFNGHKSDKCFWKILRCDVTEDCFNFALVPYQSGYYVTHQLLHLIIAQFSCYDQTKDFLTKSNTTFQQLHDTFCSNVFDEASHIVAKNYPEEHRDLFCEQKFICGMLGYSDFFDRVSMKEIFSWQEPSGCFKFRDSETNARKKKHGKKRIKRNEVEMNDTCLPHYTTVCAGAIAMYIRTLILDPNL